MKFLRSKRKKISRNRCFRNISIHSLYFVASSQSRCVIFRHNIKILRALIQLMKIKVIHIVKSFMVGPVFPHRRMRSSRESFSLCKLCMMFCSQKYSPRYENASRQHHEVCRAKVSRAQKGHREEAIE